MAASKKADVKEKSIQVLMTDLAQKRDDLFKAQLDHVRRKLKNTTSLTHMRKDIARILTTINMKKGASV